MQEHQLTRDNFVEILKINEAISHIKDVDSLMDRVLHETRAITNADAGSIYLTTGDKLTFEYVQNDTLSQRDRSSNKYIYAKQELPVNSKSISGYVALNREPLILDDVYDLPAGVPYTFNYSFDQLAGYHSQSMLTVPLITSRDTITGVMQIINAKNEQGKPIPFTKADELLVTLFANQAAVAIERARMTREIILRMIKIAEMRDPKETGAHVNRVGAISIEIYQRWAQKNHVPEKRIKKVKDILRIAAMLHDVGKVAIADAVLKKRGRLNETEFDVMKHHTIFGARLFRDSKSDWDDMAAAIALNHHERWDGNGYPGHLDDIFEDHTDLGPGKKGETIPLTARIVALADVFDALMSKRAYKPSWEEKDVLEYIEMETGRHFDPSLVEAFHEIYDVIKAILQKYPSEEE